MNVENNVEALIEAQNLTDGPEQATPGQCQSCQSSLLINDSVNKQQIRSVVQHIRFLTLTPQQFADCAARTSLLTLSEDNAVLVNIVSDEPIVPMPRGLSTSRIRRDKVGKARSEATFSYTVQNIRSLVGVECSPVFYVRNLPWWIEAWSRGTGGTKCLYLDVECNAESKSTDWSCKANIECRLICHKPGAENLVKRGSYVFRRGSITGRWLYIQLDNLLDPTHGYIQDDAITVEVHITVDEPQGVI